MKKYALLSMAALLAGTALSAPALANGDKDRASLLTAPSEQTTIIRDTAQHPAHVLSLSDALRLAYENNPSIRAARAQLLATQERLPQAQAGWKPTADMNADITYTDIESRGGAGAGNSNNTEKNIGAQVNQPLYRGGRTVSGVASAKNVIMAQRSFLEATEHDVLLQVVTAYMNVLRDQSLHDLAVNNREVIARQLAASRARFEVGDVTRTDVSQSEARLAGADANVVRARGNLHASRAVFRQVTGVDAGETLHFPSEGVNIPPSLDDAVNMAEQYNPSVMAAQYLHNAAQEDIDSVFGELLPSVGLFARLSHAVDPSPGQLDSRTTSALGISASVPLYEGGATRSRVRQARTTASQRRIEVEEAKRLARQQTVSAWEGLEAARSEITSRRAQVDANQIARDGVHKEAELGTRTILDALDADQELLDARSALVTAQRNEVVARYTLAATLGLMTPNNLGFPELAQDYNDHLREVTAKIFSTRTAYPGAE